MVSWPRGNRMVIMVAIASIVLLIVVSLVLGSSLRSPEQAAADAAAPSASLITVAAERRTLSQPIVLRGRVLAGFSEKILPPASAVGPNSVVTAVPMKKGQSIREGGVLVAIAGQPVFGLNLAFPLYRDLIGGMKGPDVSEIQRTLRRLGYRANVTGTLDWPTLTAIGRLFKDRGYAAKPGRVEAAAGLPAARAAVEQAQAALDAAIAAGTGIAAAQATLDAAQQTLSTMELEAGPGLPQSGVVRIGRGGTVTGVRVAVGDVLDKPDMVLFEVNGGGAFVAVGASRDQVNLIHTGQRASIVDEATGRTATATVDEIGTEPSNDQELGLSGFMIRLSFVGEGMSPIADRTVRVDLAADTSDTPVLAVPVTAIYSRADGSTFVTVVRADGTTEDITVTAGRIAGGWVEVASTGDRQLAPGDPVVVGQGSRG